MIVLVTQDRTTEQYLFNRWLGGTQKIIGLLGRFKNYRKASVIGNSFGGGIALAIAKFVTQNE